MIILVIIVTVVMLVIMIIIITTITTIIQIATDSLLPGRVAAQRRCREPGGKPWPLNKKAAGDENCTVEFYGSIV